MSLESGLYAPRASPTTEYGSLYATGNGVNEIVTVAQHTPPAVERQVWNIQAVHGKEGVYTITLDTTGSTFGGHWFPKDGEPIPKDPIVVSEKSYEWYIPYTKDIPAPGVKNITGVYVIYPRKVPHHQFFSIQAHTKLIGVGLYAGTNDKDQVVIISVPVVPGAEAPYWQARHLVKRPES
ncbi:hypothetical protein K443DRAFT_679431 [Laccaria amethystina LaAM-08-1]|uniref:Uncharacterized protein n=1 Tax=Laccaria amethystina LaAM-08-1 TaxID=1095629 RepID=A0A0C9XQW5_9AGAR|nr:hypothetical protein K443DRAFT_679431 [Laccaria amethystina LaAM-08-1]